jgi:CRP-like cAMP-binding protein
VDKLDYTIDPSLSLKPLTLNLRGSHQREEFCDILERLDLCKDLSRRQVEILADNLHVFQALPGTIVLKEGSKGQVGDLCLVVQGKLDVYKEAHVDDLRKIAEIHRGKHLGELSFIDSQPHSATVVAAAPSTIAILSQANFDAIAEHYPPIGIRLLWQVAYIMSQRLRKTSADLVDHL